MNPTSPTLVGRAQEREALAAALAAMRARPGTIVAIEGEPGIGKSRLLAHLATGAEGCAVLEARASEYEDDLPYGLWAEALGDGLTEDPGADRHRMHRALRELLERLAATRPLALCLDDVHWADPASIDALAALVRRPPAGPVLLAVASREGQMPPSLAAAIGAALREDRVVALTLGPLTKPEAAELVGDAAGAIYADAGGNPFYLEQLARVRGAPRGSVAVAPDGSVPPAVAAALAAELAGLLPAARRALEAAAVAGDPFEPDLAAEVAELTDAEALKALDELLACGLVRPTAAPRRFAFRHPVVRHAVYTAMPGGSRLGAHARAADALERRGAGAIQRAHHVEHAARGGAGDRGPLLRRRPARARRPARGSRAAHRVAVTARRCTGSVRRSGRRPAHVDRSARDRARR